MLTIQKNGRNHLDLSLIAASPAHTTPGPLPRRITIEDFGTHYTVHVDARFSHCRVTALDWDHIENDSLENLQAKLDCLRGLDLPADSINAHCHRLVDLIDAIEDRLAPTPLDNHPTLDPSSLDHPHRSFPAMTQIDNVRDLVVAAFAASINPTVKVEIIDRPENEFPAVCIDDGFLIFQSPSTGSNVDGIYYKPFWVLSKKIAHPAADGRPGWFQLERIGYQESIRSIVKEAVAAWVREEVEVTLTALELGDQVKVAADLVDHGVALIDADA